MNYNDYAGSGTALIAAARDANVPMVKLLLRNGADPSQSAKFQGSPLTVARSALIRRMPEQALRQCRDGIRSCREMPPASTARP